MSYNVYNVVNQTFIFFQKSVYCSTEHRIKPTRLSGFQSLLPQFLERSKQATASLSFDCSSVNKTLVICATSFTTATAAAARFLRISTAYKVPSRNWCPCNPYTTSLWGRPVSQVLNSSGGWGWEVDLIWSWRHSKRKNWNSNPDVLALGPVFVP